MMHYELIGTQPAVAHVNVEATVQDFKSTRLGSRKTELGNTLVKAAAHFYGLSLADFGSVLELADAVVAVEQYTMVH